MTDDSNGEKKRPTLITGIGYYIAGVLVGILALFAGSAMGLF